MAIYGDGKHNENMEYNAPKYVVTDRTVYRTTHWTIETHSENGDGEVYYVQCQEGDMYDTWIVQNDEETLDNDTELAQELIERCETYEDWYMDSDEKDNNWGYDGEGEAK
jgi:hypothetical protein